MSPLPFQWDGEAMRISPSFQRRADDAFVIGETYNLQPVEDRSAASHRHYFAAINEAWQNLPEALAEDFPTAEHLRKKALIRAGYRDERSFVCASKAEAVRLAAFLRPVDDFSLVSVNGTAVVQLTAKSQSVRAMGKAEFQKSKDDVLAALAAMIGVQTHELHQAAGVAANDDQAVQGRAA
jgi:hypothetical protein